MVIFYSLLNLAAVNSMVIYYLQNPNNEMPRRQIIHMLPVELAEAYHRRNMCRML